MLTHVRAVLSILKFRGHPDLQSTVVSKAQNYWLKITGASEMHTRGVKVFMINGQGRWLASTRARAGGHGLQVLAVFTSGEDCHLQLLMLLTLAGARGAKCRR